MKRFVRIRTKNFTADPLKKSIITDKRVIVRLGSLTPTTKIFPTQRDVVEINTVEAIQNSRDKLKMKDCFSRLEIPQAEWYRLNHDFTNIEFPLVGKAVCGFKGHGMRLLTNKEELTDFIRTHNDSFYIEKFYNYAREYRLHVANDIGVFMSWRKLRTETADNRWFFNSSNCNWVNPEHELFDRPTNWKEIERQAMNCLTATGLNLGAVDIRVQSSKKDNPHFIVCEINSAPALGELGVTKYKEIIQKLIIDNHD